MRPLVIDDDVRAEIARILEHAEQHPYEPSRPDAAVPGNDPRHVLTTEHGFRAVFSYTEAEGMRFRHLSVSVPRPHLPAPAAVWLLAQEFGFTGGDVLASKPAADWRFGVSARDNCIVVIQRILGDEEMPA